MKGEFEEILKSKLYEAETPVGYEPDWEDFVAFRKKTTKKRRKKAFIVLSRSVAALFILAVSIFGLTKINKHALNNQESLLKGNTTTFNKEVSANSADDELPETKSDMPANEGPVAVTTSGDRIVDSNSEVLLYVNSMETAPAYPEAESFANEEDIVRVAGYSIGKVSLDGFYAKRNDNLTAQVKDPLYDIDEYLRAFEALYTDDGDNDNKEWSASLFANALAMSDNPNGEVASFSGIDEIPILSAGKIMTVSNYANSGTESNGVLTSQGSDYYKDYLGHQPPLILSIAVSRGVLSRVDISSGLVYSFLRSEYTEYSTFSSYSQKLHYIGVPVSLSYEFLPDISRYSFYSVGGVLFEKAVSAIGVTKVFDGPTLELYQKNSLNTPKIMVSGNLGMGVGYDIIDVFGLYLESYLSYYFYTLGQPVSYRTANDLSINIKVGLKYKF